MASTGLRSFLRAPARTVHRAPVLCLPLQARRRLLVSCSAAIEDSYAIIDVGGLKHFVEEGTSFACNKQALAELPLGNIVQFDKVVAFKSEDGELYRGRPYLDNVVVEGLVEDEFQGPVMSGSFTAAANKAFSQDLMLQKILITRIKRAASDASSVAHEPALSN